MAAASTVPYCYWFTWIKWLLCGKPHWSEIKVQTSEFPAEKTEKRERDNVAAVLWWPCPPWGGTVKYSVVIPSPFNSVFRSHYNVGKKKVILHENLGTHIISSVLVSRFLSETVKVLLISSKSIEMLKVLLLFLHLNSLYVWLANWLYLPHLCTLYFKWAVTLCGLGWQHYYCHKFCCSYCRWKDTCVGNYEHLLCALASASLF